MTWFSEYSASPRRSLARSAIRCPSVDRFAGFSVPSRVSGHRFSPRDAPFPPAGPGESGSPRSAVLRRRYDFPRTHSRTLMTSVPGSTRSSVFVLAEALPERRRTVSGPGGFGQPVSPPPAVRVWARAGSLRFPGVPSHTSARLSDPGRTSRTSPFAVLPMLPPGPTRRRLQRAHDFGAQPRASVSAAYASRATLPPPMQGSLPAGGLRLYREGVEPSGTR
jgi:hypothetical protein